MTKQITETAMKYQKKPIVIDAIQWDGTKSGKNMITDVFSGIDTIGQAGSLYKDEMTDWRIATLEGSHKVSPGDYIVKGVMGEFYPCKPDIFELTYTKVMETATDPAGELASENLQVPGAVSTIMELVTNYALLSRFHSDVGSSQARAKVVAALEPVTKDAARYRWLRATTDFVTNSKGERLDIRNQPEEWDVVIDAAMGEQQ